MIALSIALGFTFIISSVCIIRLENMVDILQTRLVGTTEKLDSLAKSITSEIVDKTTVSYEEVEYYSKFEGQTIRIQSTNAGFNTLGLFVEKTRLLSHEEITLLKTSDTKIKKLKKRKV